MAIYEQENQEARDVICNGKRLNFRGIYFIGLSATAIGIGVIIFLNLATPLEYIHGRLTASNQNLARQLAPILNLAFLLLLSCPLILFLIRRFLSPLSEYLNLIKAGRKSEHILEKARQRLIERERMQLSLNLAKEVQQNLLPKTNLKIDGFDIAGKSVYCDETGGDYYDFISIMENDNQKIGVAIGDVSGHGISSALLMATVRSSLRQRLSLPGSTAEIISNVNRQLVQDVEDSGQFVTMFYLTIDPIKKHLQYVRAGHDPAIFYDPNTDAFEELGGAGMALGVDENWDVKAYTKTALKNGQIIFLSTDGIWEARNPQGETFGKGPIYDIIRNNSSLSANEILKVMIESLRSFQKDAKIEDDITLVIIKIID